MFLILENHAHLIAQSENLGRDTARFKSYAAKRIIAFLIENNVKTILDQLAFYKKAHKKDRNFQLWQEGVHPEIVQSMEMMRQKVEYIHNNPVKRGYVEKAEHWMNSSARDYLGHSGPIPICKKW